MLLTQMSEQIRQMLRVLDCDKFAYLNNIDRNGDHVEGHITFEVSSENKADYIGLGTFLVFNNVLKKAFGIVHTCMVELCYSNMQTCHSPAFSTLNICLICSLICVNNITSCIPLQ